MKAGLECAWKEKTFPAFCERMSGFLEKNGGKYFVGNSVSNQKLQHGNLFKSDTKFNVCS